MKFATKTIHSGQPSEPETGALVAPIFQTSTYEQEAPGQDKGFSYSRTNNPTRQRLEEVLAALENVKYAAAFASGLAAENAILQAYLRPGDEIIIPLDVYGGTYRILNKVFQPIGVIVRQIETGDLKTVEATVNKKTRLVWIESPTNPRLQVNDIAAIAKLAHANGALLVVDNTFATPYFQQPFELGADIVVHSVTKYLAGHSDTIQGAALAKDATVFEPIKFLQNATGAVPSPFDCWLTLRGIKTLELRMQRHEENAIAIANALNGHPLVRRVYFPGLAEHPGHEIARKQMSGFGGMVSFELEGTKEEVVSFASSREFFALGESLGGVKALICHPATMTHASIPAEERAKLGLSDSLLRLSPGCEASDDLVEDLLEGLSQIENARSSKQAVGAASK
ncbi:MAG TPA: aminotransferase class I/II-fold pyridoxal phosphate-dependent enzyme [Candidatus Acidoferrales bacterium]|jgi:cystathionine beta-lyase/cystathionine gamma-synthase|nr:aminotransferase class I/II-fold pyridoxal phosphate-dependent enzyme [Candidatus Acidoferrales bacterium]